MKAIVTDFGLFEKMTDCNDTLNYKRILQKTLYRTIIWSGGTLGVTSVVKGDAGFINLKNILTYSVLFLGLCFLECRGAEIKEKNNKTARQKNLEEFEDFVNGLSHLEVNTDTDLIKNSEVNTSEYSVYFRNFIPRIAKKKYILVPSKSPYNIKEVFDISIVQLHEMGDDRYIYYKDEPHGKKKKLVPRTNFI